ncbi:HlyD family secretion protein [Acinetobacter qingfengensis]|uniref:Efflux transporter periplasmic adaptor subunit n=1 Tax=Acinetobacter qingfengensis TaxID=1262585 RepID=A0A1E7RFK9_9GAMM|nr:HlyD family secretion protein [Acinetobacter qingfengensis]KAA8732736.1 HlyD family secretion protein [Acinetobacter qingfengensis]OEY98148.1 efflux transporter periplasmic adaptor subunit [Acinetobacter qingfengensis]
MTTSSSKPDLKTFMRPLIFIVVLIIAIFTIQHLWNYYNNEPWTRDGRVRADVINVASDVSGLVTEILVQDNQNVKKGQILFKLDTSRQQLAIEQAQSDLAKAQASLAQSEANVAAAQANIVKSKADIKLADRNAQRYSTLMDGAISRQEQDQMFAQRDQSHAEYQQMLAALQQANASVKQQKASVVVAQSALDLAKLNAHRSQVVAPEDGTLSNFSLRVGNYVQTGQAIAALIDRKKMYVVGYFEETKLNKINIGDQASVELMGDSHKIKGHVQGIASGIEDRERSTSSGLLANVNPTFTWVRLAQRVPVKIVLDEDQTHNLAFVAGRTATVHILAKKD